MMAAHAFADRIDAAALDRPYGFVRKVAQGHFEATGPMCMVGDICEIDPGSFGQAPVLAQVAGVDDARIILVPLRQGRAVPLGARVVAMLRGAAVPVGPGFAGRAVDGMGQPFDGKGMIAASETRPISGTVPGPLDRGASSRIVATGLKAIDGLLTLAEGQRIGVFAASGVGKTSLIEQLASQMACDRCIVCLVGERGREVEAIWRALSAEPDADRFTIVAATSDESAALRARSVSYALCLAEYWRDRGEHVVLIVDSVTRLAMALREIGLAAGEPPTVRAYTPNVFSALPRIVERCGTTRAGGAITAIMTVLSETDDVDDPIVEVMKSLLDGHIVLSRTLAERGHFPAIDVSRSISRQASKLMSPDHACAARDIVALLGIYDESRVMIESGVYKSGANAEIDRAIAMRAALMAFLQQRQDERGDFAATVGAMTALMRGGGA
jgi:FliI/YscN family ATPase